MKHRSAMSLIEVMIAMTIYTVAVGALFQAMIGMRAVAAVGSAQDDIMFDADRILQRMRDDLVCSGWYFPDNLAATVGVSAAQDRDLLYYPYIQRQNSGLGTKFPHHIRAPAIQGPAIPYRDLRTLTQTGAGNSTDPTAVFGLANKSAYLKSFLAQSQEIIFLRTTNGAWNETTDAISLNTRVAPMIPFSNLPRATWRSDNQQDTLRIYKASGWSVSKDVNGTIIDYPANTIKSWITGPAVKADTKPYGVVMESGMLVDPNGDISQIQPNWETLDKTGYVKPLTTDPTGNLQEISYAVVPSKYSYGCLVRLRKVASVTGLEKMNPSAGIWAAPGISVSETVPSTLDALGNTVLNTEGMVIDEVLSENVVRIVFDTYRTVDGNGASVTSLDVNQIKVRVYMARPSIQDSDVIIRRMFETVIAMRSMNSAYDKDFSQAGSNSISNRLGQTSIGIAY